MDLCKFKVSLVYETTSRIARVVTQRNGLEEKKMKRRKKKKKEKKIRITVVCWLLWELVGEADRLSHFLVLLFQINSNQHTEYVLKGNSLSVLEKYDENINLLSCEENY